MSDRTQPRPRSEAILLDAVSVASAVATVVALLGAAAHLAFVVCGEPFWDWTPTVWERCDRTAPDAMRLGGSFAASYGAWSAASLAAWLVNRGAVAAARGGDVRATVRRWARRYARIVVALVAVSLSALPLRVPVLRSFSVDLFRIRLADGADGASLIAIVVPLAALAWWLAWKLRPSPVQRENEDGLSRRRLGYDERVALRVLAYPALALGAPACFAGDGLSLIGFFAVVGGLLAFKRLAQDARAARASVADRARPASGR